ncbi:MAG: multifunctional CCA tRNA nucleotidyl transferase/2'3'-cyclic phosphodiesterase/2'nucleotidase/phosphatase, partial [Ottowia sp.]|nr:multifunctional CCA tRNA nucleotidyl transferase/2'3'-cyclic phosphodiesterase/2'nucleotidase/phosphatase [Ottowia sp.]
DARGRLGMEDDAYPQRPRLLAALAAAQGVQTASVAQAAMAHGAQGAAIGQAVAKARAQAVQGWMDEAAAAR